MPQLTLKRARYILTFENDNTKQVKTLKKYFKDKKELSFYKEHFDDIPVSGVFPLFHLARTTNDGEILKWIFEEKIKKITLTPNNCTSIYNHLVDIIDTIQFEPDMQSLVDTILEYYPLIIILAFLTNKWINYTNYFKIEAGYFQKMTYQEQAQSRSLKRIQACILKDYVLYDTGQLAQGCVIYGKMSHKLKMAQQISFDAYGYKNIIAVYPTSNQFLKTLECIQIAL